MSDGTSIPEWDARYRERLPIFERLAGEVEFALTSTTRKDGIKTHSISSRVKSPNSVAEKARRKELANPLNELDDLVGIRVVVLFLSDLPKLDQLVRESFEIHTAEDKISEGDPASFGYMSVHYVATLGGDHSGPRYDDLKGIRFEIQTRTVVMDAWANVSHYLDYKGQSSIPDDLRRDFFALSGLFHVADQHFEIFAQRSGESQARAEAELDSEPGTQVEVNLDTMDAFLGRRYPDRNHSDRSSISEFVEEVVAAGYEDLGVFGSALDRGDDRFEEYEKAHPPGFRDDGDRRFADLGAARITLALVDESYSRSIYEDDDPVERFATWAA